MTRKELIEKFAEHCGECSSCSQCRFYHRTVSIGECLDTYLRQLRSGEKKLEDSFEEATEGGRE